MTEKEKLIRGMLREFRLAQQEPWSPPREGRVGRIAFPPLLPTGTDVQLPATDELLHLIGKYADLTIENDPVIKASHGYSEWYEIVRRSVGEAIYRAEYAFSDERLVPALRASVDGSLKEELTSSKADLDLVLGCWLFEDTSLYPISVGPVTFSSRAAWIEHAFGEGKISKITYRRLRAESEKRRIRPRSRKSMDAYRERSLVEAIGECPCICTVRSHGLSSKLVPTNGVRSARLAMTALSLMWSRPSQGLSWMHLLYDGPVFHRRYILFRDRRSGSGSSLSHMPSGYNQGDLTEGLERFKPYLDVLGAAVGDYMNPHAQRRQTEATAALFLSLWWYDQACRENSDHVAVTKFAASMDALAGGTGSEGILDLIEARLGCSRTTPIMPDGRTTKQVVDKIYRAGRSRLIHGNSREFAQDWSRVRTNAETLGRQLLLDVCDWLGKNAGVTDVGSLRSR